MRRVRALVLAGARGGEQDPVASAAGVPVKALARVAGRPMLLRVLANLHACPEVGELHLALDPGLAGRPELKAELAALGVRCHPPGTAIAATVARVFAELGAPMLVTTADHPLLSPAAVAHFLAQARRAEADVAVALVAEQDVQRRWPTTRRTWLRFRDGRYTGANLFLLNTPAAAQALAAWRQSERERKRPLRLVARLGFGLLLGYALFRWTLDEAFARLSQRVEARIRPIPLPFPEAAVDVDRPQDLQLAEQLLAAGSGEAVR